MQICVVGINYKKTPVAVRSRVAIGSAQLPEALKALHNYVRQGIILATCNRTEIHTASEASSDQTESIRFLAERGELSPEELTPHIYAHYGEDSVRHLFSVASGLDSMITGEYEILGQVKKALEEARKSRLVELPLLTLFQQSVRTGRRVREETAISRNATSVSSVAVDLATRIVGDIRRQRIVVVGAGEAGTLVAKACLERGASNIVVVNRSPKKGAGLAITLEGKWVPMEGLGQELAGCDVAICCSGAPHTVLKLRTIEEAMKARKDRALVIIDIAVPRNVDVSVKSLKNVFLYDIDDLVNTCQVNHNHRQDELQSATAIVDTEVSKFIGFWQELAVRPLVKALLERAEDIRQAKLTMTLKKMPDLTDEQKLCLDTMTRAIVQNILHEPVKCLKSNHKKEGFTRVVEELFSLDK